RAWALCLTKASYMEDNMNASQQRYKSIRSRATRFVYPVAFLAVLLAGVYPAMARNSKGALWVMTYNVNEGTDYLQVLSATTPQQFLIGVGDIVSQVQGTNPPE